MTHPNFNGFPNCLRLQVEFESFASRKFRQMSYDGIAVVPGVDLEFYRLRDIVQSIDPYSFSSILRLIFAYLDVSTVKVESDYDFSTWKTDSFFFKHFNTM